MGADFFFFFFDLFPVFFLEVRAGVEVVVSRSSGGLGGGVKTKKKVSTHRVTSPQTFQKR